MTPRAARLCMVAATLLWGATFVVIRDTLAHLDPLPLVFTRFVLAACLFAPEGAQTDVGVTLDAPVPVPGRLPVPSQQQARGIRRGRLRNVRSGAQFSGPLGIDIVRDLY